jgi:hypothetical protein
MQQGINDCGKKKLPEVSITVVTLTLPYSLVTFRAEALPFLVFGSLFRGKAMPGILSRR